jgi:hypothetical protein
MRINKFDYGLSVVVDRSEEDALELRQEMEKQGGEGQAQLKRIKQLEEKVEQMGVMLNGVFLRFD